MLVFSLVNYAQPGVYTNSNVNIVNIVGRLVNIFNEIANKENLSIYS